MACPLTADGVHRLDGLTCPCGFVLEIAPICVSIEVTNKAIVLVSEAFNCETLDSAIRALRRAADDLERRNRA